MSVKNSDLLDKKDIKEKLFLLEKYSNTDYITMSGNFYKKVKNKYYKKKIQINKYNGYAYIQITDKNNNNKSKRVHRLIAEMFISNPNNYKIVGHKNNIKHDNRIENLYWTTVSENTQKAYDDGLAVNKKGFEDSQSIPVTMIKRRRRMITIKTFGSLKECHRYSKINIRDIKTRCENTNKKPFRKFKEYKFNYYIPLEYFKKCSYQY